MLGAAVVTAGFLVLVRAPKPTMIAQLGPRTGKPPIALSPGHLDELAMRDLAPLFLPTRHNAAPTPLVPHEPGAAYFEKDPGVHTLFDPDNPGLHMPPPVSPPQTPVEALTNVPPPLAQGLGRTDLAVTPLPANGGHLDVFSSATHASLLGVTLGADALAPLAGRETLGWKPLEFLAVVDATGLVGPLTLTSTSGVEEVDNHFRNYLAATFRIGDRLPPGFYRIVVGP
jgi:hypothetical protein